jgi:hypothetical protein
MLSTTEQVDFDRRDLAKGEANANSRQSNEGHQADGFMPLYRSRRLADKSRWLRVT